MRLDHWIKQLFVIPGIIVAWLLLPDQKGVPFLSYFLGIVSVSFIASANYVINEFLDAESDRFHPTKKFRAAVLNRLDGRVVFFEWVILGVLGLSLSLYVGHYFSLTNLVLLVMGLLYNVHPFRFKDVAFLDVIVESVNNLLRFLLGWFMVTDIFFAPVSILIGYWMGGAFLMAMKRFAEYRMIDNPELAATYRKSFRHYTSLNLLLSSFFYALCSTFFIGIFLIKYKIELIFFMPFVFGFFCYYVYMSFEQDSAVQKPEKLYKDKFLMFYSVALIILFFIFINCSMPSLNHFQNNELIRLVH